MYRGAVFLFELFLYIYWTVDNALITVTTIAARVVGRGVVAGRTTINKARLSISLGLCAPLVTVTIGPGVRATLEPIDRAHEARLGVSLGLGVGAPLVDM